MYNPAQCLENVRKIDPNAKLCPESLCTSSAVADILRRFCSCQPPYPPQNPCPYGPDSPVAVYGDSGMCFCCCGSVGAEASVAVDAGEERDVGDVWVGQMVKVARRVD